MEFHPFDVALTAEEPQIYPSLQLLLDDFLRGDLPSPAMSHFRHRIALLFLLCSISLGLQHSGLALDFARDDGNFRLQLNPGLQMTLWHSEQPTDGLASFETSPFFAPRLELDASASIGSTWFFHFLGRYDRGFDPGAAPDGELRIDELFARWSPMGDSRIQLQVGKFATLFGNWVSRHDFWDNPFLQAPLPYDRMTTLNDAALVTSAGLRQRWNREDQKQLWLPAIWGPSYTTGAAVMGSIGHFDYAVEVKNASLSSRPESWSPLEDGLDHPTWNARLGWRPSAMWAFGASASRGAYLLDTSTPLPDGKDRDDYPETHLGLDWRWAWRHFELTGEVIGTRFETPLAGDLDILSYYVEGRWKVDPACWVAARFGQQFFSELDLPGADPAWDRDAWRIELAFGYKITPDILLKTQASHTREKGGGMQGENKVGMALGIRF